MRFNISTIIVLVVLFTSCTSQKTMVSNNDMVTADEGWIDMFNGKDLSGWTTKVHHYESGDNYANTFRMEDGMIKVRYDEYDGTFKDRFAHLYYDTPLSYYQLSLEYRFVGEVYPGAPGYVIKNSGIMFHSQSPNTMLKEQNWPISVEMQFLAGIKEGVPRPTGNMCSPGTAIVYEGKLNTQHCINSTSETLYGDQWVKAELRVYGDSLVQHFINDKLVMEYEQPQVGGAVVEGFDPEHKIDGTILSIGHVALQSEGQPIDFRNVRLKNLKGCMDKSSANYKSHYIKHDPSECN